MASYYSPAPVRGFVAAFTELLREEFAPTTGVSDMSGAERWELYTKIEALRGRPLVVFVTSSRLNAHGEIGADAVTQLLDQLQLLTPDTTKLDFLIASQGGDPTAAYRMVSLLRERV